MTATPPNAARDRKRDLDLNMGWLSSREVFSVWVGGGDPARSGTWCANPTTRIGVGDGAIHGYGRDRLSSGVTTTTDEALKKLSCRALLGKRRVLICGRIHAD
jgi:hypothetical protein